LDRPQHGHLQCGADVQAVDARVRSHVVRHLDAASAFRSLRSERRADPQRRVLVAQPVQAAAAVHDDDEFPPGQPDLGAHAGLVECVERRAHPLAGRLVVDHQDAVADGSDDQEAGAADVRKDHHRARVAQLLLDIGMLGALSERGEGDR